MAGHCACAPRPARCHNYTATGGRLTERATQGQSVKHAPTMPVTTESMSGWLATAQAPSSPTTISGWQGTSAMASLSSCTLDESLMATIFGWNSLTCSSQELGCMAFTNCQQGFCDQLSCASQSICSQVSSAGGRLEPSVEPAWACSHDPCAEHRLQHAGHDASSVRQVILL